ncbi:MAG TPA: type II toxin-antitoxin system RelE/ParE family toxin [Verrucomicrobiae bacterium]|nr:type II toxin-antitoxin system RelE/ParE family toxin [Verrucomicrobiae bacterium]
MSRQERARGEKPLFWVASSLNDLLAFPEKVQKKIGAALSLAQFGGKHPSAKPWKGAGSGVFEIVEEYRSDAYRAIYTVKFADAVYVLHAFQKKSPSGIRTSRRDVELVTQRLKLAQQEYEARHGQ